MNIFKRNSRKKVPAENRAEDDNNRTISLAKQEEVTDYGMITDESCPVRIAKFHHIGKRQYQQDCFGFSDVTDQEIISQRGILAVMADGMGGLKAGEKVSALATVSMLSQFEEMDILKEPGEALLEMVENVNEKVNEFLGSDGIGRCGSTLVTVIIRDNKLYWCSVGDSLIYLVRDGKIRPLNKQHTYAAQLAEQVEKGIITQEEADTNPQRNALTSYLGIGNLEEIDRNEEPVLLEENDRIMLMSDGVFGTISIEEMEELMKHEILECAMKMNYQVISKEKRNQDNYTALIMEIK